MMRPPQKLLSTSTRLPPTLSWIGIFYVILVTSSLFPRRVVSFLQPHLPSSISSSSISSSTTQLSNSLVQSIPTPLSQIRQRRRLSATTSLFVATSSRQDSNNNSKNKTTRRKEQEQQKRQQTNKNQNHNPRVVYQKVMKSPTTDVYGRGNPVFLGHLVEYLQEHFEIPDTLPMVYESMPLSSATTDSATDGDGDGDDKSIVIWDSPMSYNPDVTRLYLEVIAIYTDDPEIEKSAMSEQQQQRQQQQQQQERRAVSATTVPTMAMVVVRKTNLLLLTEQTKISPMMQNLFDDSEKRILKALDRGLDDFVAGKIIALDSSRKQDDDDNNNNDDDNNNNASSKTTTTPTRQIRTSSSQEVLQTAQDAMIEELLESATDIHSSVKDSSDSSDNDNHKKDDDIVDADFTRVEEEKESTTKKQQQQQKSKTTKKTETLSDLDSSSSQGYAIRAAAKVAAERNQNKTTKKADKQNNDENVDFAVAAAQKIAKQKDKQAAAWNSNSSKESSNSPAAVAGAAAVKEMRTKSIVEAPATKSSVPEESSGLIADGGGHDRTFRTTFSTPKSFAAKQGQGGIQKKQANNNAIKGTKSTNTKMSTSGNQKEPKKRKLNLKVVDKDDLEDDASDDKKEISSNKKSNKKVDPNLSKTFVSTNVKQNKTGPSIPSDQDIMKTAQDVMSELAEQGTDMTAEEMLESVLKFGEKEKQNNEVGSGFVSGAFEMAKELLQEQKRKRDSRTNQQQQQQVETEYMGFEKEASKAKDAPQVKEREISSEEEELRKMFEAGERLADGRITIATRGGDKVPAMSEEEEEQVDELIANEKSVSDHARVLDDELAELEVQIRQTPGEENDGPSFEKSPLFDVFSGPEVYDPNVDPEEAVNWPGARPGTSTKAVEAKLPKELGEAVKYAKFASEVMQKLEARVDGDKTSYFVGNRELSEEQVNSLQAVVTESVEMGIIPNPLVLMEERARLQLVLDELRSQPEERFREILENYKELLLSDNFVDLIRERLQSMADRDLEALRQRSDDDDTDVELERAHARERAILGQLVVNAQLLLKEARALGAELEAQQIEVIRSICKVAMDPSHSTEEEAEAALTDAVRDMRPLFDEMFVAYLKYAVAEEEGRLARAGVLDDPEHNQWLFVLKIVQQGVYAEIAKGINRYITHLWYILRMETATERKMLLAKLIDVMPTLDVRPFVRVVDNIVGSLGEAAKGEFDGGYELGKMTNKLMQLHRDVKELLPPERIDMMSRDADEWAARQKKRMLEQRNLTKQRLKAARETESYDEEIEALLGKRGEFERFD